MAEQAAAAATKPTLDELFVKAGLQQVPGVTRLRSLRRELQCLRFAQLYVKANFDPFAAYRMFSGRKKDPTRWGVYWMTDKRVGPRVAFHIREIVQEATRGSQRFALLTVEQVLEINQALITADATDLIEQVEVEGKLITRFRMAHTLTRQQRMPVRTIRIRNGEVTMMENHDKLDAIKVYVALMDVLNSRGGNDQTWVQNFQRLMGAARQKRIDLEVEAGRVARLPPPRPAPL